MLVNWLDDDCTPCISSNTGAADLHSSRWYISCTSQWTLLIWANFSKCYKGRKLHPLNWSPLITT